MPDINERLTHIEQRLFAIERHLGVLKEIPRPTAAPGAARPGTAPLQGTVPPARNAASQATAAGPTLHAPPPAPSQADSVSATQLMAWGAGFALLLAAVYFLKLVYDVGWLTPERQLGLATLAGIALIVGGIWFARIDRAYAAFLPALGLIILYLVAYAAHLYFHLWSGQIAISAVCAVTITGIWLGRRFDQSVYPVLAASGVYLSPLLMQAAPGRLMDVIIFYSAWSLLFSFCALNEGRRITYILPMFFALIGFDLIWRTAGESNWLLAFIYQLIQFSVFAVTAAAFSVMHERPLNGAEGLVHGCALVCFYGLEYLLLHQHAPHWAPIVGLSSAAAVLIIYVAARAAFKNTQPMGVGALIVSAYCSVVVAHAVFFELVPHALIPWAALVMTLGVGIVLLRQSPRSSATLLPMYIVAAVIFSASYLSLLEHGARTTDVELPNLALALYAGVLYGGYYLFSRAVGGWRAAPIMLYAGHFAFMELGLRMVDNAFTLSMLWASFAIVVLVVAMASKDKLLGQSALLLFCAAGLKVLLHDLAASSSLVRVVTLIVLAASLYLGGWLYQSLVRGIVTYHPDAAINRQINAIRTLAQKKMSAREIALELTAQGYRYHGEGSWSEEKVVQILRDYRLQTAAG